MDSENKNLPSKDINTQNAIYQPSSPKNELKKNTLSINPNVCME